MRTQAGITLGGEGAGSGYAKSGVPEYQRGFLEKYLVKVLELSLINIMQAS